jgi:DNA-directed RNA polymerase specialized sigma24 family protein
MKTGWSLTAESLEKFLAWLSPNREEATVKYQQIEKRLIVFFGRGGCHVPEDLFDKTIDVACKKIDSGTVERSVDPTAYCYGVARNVLREYRREKKPLPMPEDFAAPRGGPEWDEQELACMEECLDQLAERQRDLVTRYYEAEGAEKIRARKALAAETGGANMLRIKVFRIRLTLRDCVSECVKQKVEGLHQ